MSMKEKAKFYVLVGAVLFIAAVAYVALVVIPFTEIAKENLTPSSSMLVKNTPVPQESAKNKEALVISTCENIAGLEKQLDERIEDCAAILNVLKTFNPLAEWVAPHKGAWLDSSLEALEAHEDSLQSDIADISNAETEMLSDLSGYLDKRKITNAIVLLPSNSVIDIGSSSLVENIMIVSYLGYTSIPRTGEDRQSFDRSYRDWWPSQFDDTLPSIYNLSDIPKYHMALYLGSKHADSFRANLQKITQQ